MYWGRTSISITWLGSGMPAQKTGTAVIRRLLGSDVRKRITGQRSAAKGGAGNETARFGPADQQNDGRFATGERKFLLLGCTIRKERTIKERSI